jgi:uncharacterized lipoprotein YajG
MMFRASLILLLIITVLTGCQSASDDTITTPASSSVSAIPWNKPASWEGAGALGGFSPQGGH